jgi:DNA-binding response OmpR family regulator
MPELPRRDWDKHHPARYRHLMRVLMVEDDPILAKEVGRGLEEYGIGVDRVATGPEAIVAATTSAFDVVLIDVMLAPTMDGFAVCRELRHRKIGAGILMLTAGELENPEVADRVWSDWNSGRPYLTQRA